MCGVDSACVQMVEGKGNIESILLLRVGTQCHSMGRVQAISHETPFTARESQLRAINVGIGPWETDITTTPVQEQGFNSTYAYMSSIAGSRYPCSNANAAELPFEH